MIKILQKLIKKSAAKIYFFSVIFLVISSCKVGPDFKPPETKILKEDNFLNAKIIENEKPMANWWKRIDDELLNNYVDRLLKENLDLKAAFQRLIQAKETAKMQTGSYFPEIGLSNNVTRSVFPGNVFAPNLPSDSVYRTIYKNQITASWEPDLFGRLRRISEGAKSNYEASKYDLEALKHSLIAQVVNSRVAIATNLELLNLSEEVLKNREKNYELVKFRYDIGANNIANSDVHLAKDLLEQAKNNVANYSLFLERESYKLDVLLGFKPGTIDPYKVKFKEIPPPLDIVTCLPIDLLDRRPDLKSSKLRIKAANAEIGVAVADLYPNLSITGVYGFGSTQSQNIFSSDNIMGDLVGSLTMKLFQGGRLRANIKLQKAETEELIATYSKNILEAIREVEDALKSEDEIGNKIENSERSLESLEMAKNIAKKRYESGIETFKNFLDIEQKYYQSKQNLTLVKQEKWNARISLLLALGGDWFNEGISKKLQCLK